jgi:hypothetical protein
MKLTSSRPTNRKWEASHHAAAIATGAGLSLGQSDSTEPQACLLHTWCAVWGGGGCRFQAGHGAEERLYTKQQNTEACQQKQVVYILMKKTSKITFIKKKTIYKTCKIMRYVRNRRGFKNICTSGYF